MVTIFAIAFLAAIVGIFKPYITGLKRSHFAIAAVVSFILVGVTAPKNDTAKTPAVASTAVPPPSGADHKAVIETEASPTEPASKWQYSQDKDEMRGTITRYASLQSENEVDLDFPYGEVHGQIWVRKRPEDGLQVMFSVDKGQILCHTYGNSTVSAKFDDKPIQKFGCTDSSDGSNDTAFLSSPSRALAELKKAKRLVIEAEFFQKGRQQFVFDTRALKWD